MMPRIWEWGIGKGSTRPRQVEEISRGGQNSKMISRVLDDVYEDYIINFINWYSVTNDEVFTIFIHKYNQR